MEVMTIMLTTKWYICKKCGRKFSVSLYEKKECPKCGSNKLEEVG